MHKILMFQKTWGNIFNQNCSKSDGKNEKSTSSPSDVVVDLEYSSGAQETQKFRMDKPNIGGNEDTISV